MYNGVVLAGWFEGWLRDRSSSFFHQIIPKMWRIPNTIVVLLKGSAAEKCTEAYAGGLITGHITFVEECASHVEPVRRR